MARVITPLRTGTTRYTVHCDIKGPTGAVPGCNGFADLGEVGSGEIVEVMRSQIGEQSSSSERICDKRLSLSPHIEWVEGDDDGE